MNKMKNQSNNLVWPHRILGHGVSNRDAQLLGRLISNIFGDDPLGWMEYGRFEVKDERRPSGGLQALCIPMFEDRFRFVIFVNKDDHPLRKPFLIAHETAHTFFYIRLKNERPKRALLKSDWEEDFCDTFAQTVIGKNYKDVGLEKSKVKDL